MFIGVDIGGSNMAAGLFDENRKLITTAKVKSRAKEETEVIIGQLFKVIDKLREYIPLDKKLLAIGIGVAGLVDSKTSIMKHSVNITIDEVNFKDIIKKKYDVLAKVENDVNAGVIGEWKYGAGIGHDDIIGAFVGTCIGGGVMEAVGEQYLPKIKRVARGSTFSKSFDDCDFKLAKLGDQAGVYGAMQIVASEFN